MLDFVSQHGVPRAGVLEAGFGEYLRAFTDGPSLAELLDREGGRRQPFLRRSLPPAVRAPLIRVSGGVQTERPCPLGLPFLRRSLPPAVRAPVARLGFFDVFQQDACGFPGLPVLRRSLPPAGRAPSRGLQGLFRVWEPRRWSRKTLSLNRWPLGPWECLWFHGPDETWQERCNAGELMAHGHFSEHSSAWHLYRWCVLA